MKSPVARLAAAGSLGLACLFLTFAAYFQFRRPAAQVPQERTAGPSGPISELPIDPGAAPHLAVPRSQPLPFTNEDLHAFLEQEQKRAGIKKIYLKDEPQGRRPPKKSPEQEQAMEKARAKMRSMALDIQLALEARKKAPVPLRGDKAILLSKPEDSYAAKGAPADGQGPISGPAPGGIVVRSQDELDRFWRAMKSSLPMPKVNFSRQMVVAVIADESSGRGVLIPRIRKTSREWIVQYRDVLPGEDGAHYGFQVTDRTEKPVVFQKLPPPDGESRK